MQITEVIPDDLLNAVVAEEDSDAEEQYHISLNALSGASRHNAIRLRALVQNKVLLMLVDSGSSHSFIDLNFAQLLGLQLCPISPSLVQVANGDFLSCQYVVPNFTWWIQGQTFSYDLKVV